MNKLIYLIVTILFFSSNLFAEKVSSVKISGNQRVSDETIKIYGEIEINKNYEESDINKVLNNLYSTDFFEDIKIRLENNVLYVNLKEYPVISQLIFLLHYAQQIGDYYLKLIHQYFLIIL